ncbi:hypothetical protein [Halochromatium roseum]|uniref:hypothetical protein n=1 Tax=Halochromatium roseum TaxID=391920 RepID=UPI00191372E0|nr:hypothetical protein [Halochromatium roseum]MBK5939383.1 hypothetical protein [Halochromatium roseum]
MSAAFDLYTKLKHSSSDEERAEVIAQAFDALEARFPQLNDLATQGHVREAELRLQKEIKEVEARLQKDIKALELQIKEVDARLQERISQLEVSLHQALAAQTRWLIGGLAILGVVLKLADVLIGP